jgi:hypothetical protein
VNVVVRSVIVAALLGAVDLGDAFSNPAAAAQSTQSPDNARVAAALDAVLFGYLDATYGPQDVAPLRSAGRPAAFSARLRALTGLDPLELGESVMKLAERAAAERPAEPGPTIERIAGPFVLRTTGNSPAERDLDLIARSVVSAYERTATALSIQKQEQASRQLFDDTGRIEVKLHSTRQGPAAKSLGPGMGKTSLGATIRDGSAVLFVRIEVLYLNAFSLAVLEHEAAHAAVLLGTFDATAFSNRNPKDEGTLRAAFLAGYRKDIPLFLQEGIGDWAIYKGGLYHAWSVFPPVDQLVRELRRAGKLLPLAELIAGDARFRASHHKAYSLEAAAFLGFLFDRYGATRVRTWLFAQGRDWTRSFEATFGKSLAAVEADWHATPVPPS